MNSILPSWIMARLNSSIGHYIGLQIFFCGLIGGALGLVYLQSTMEQWLLHDVIQGTLWQVFFILIIISGVATWLFVLARESAQVAQEESSRQTYLLSQEIDAHKITDIKLEKAKEVAEAANLAKSRYVVGLNHEFRTPLNTILGYSQLLERDNSIPPHRIDAIRVIRRGSEHLTGLIEGLLDISKIEEGHFSLDRNEIHLVAFFEHLVEMFQLEANVSGIEFKFEILTPLPPAVISDEKRLRQIYINILSNAFKYTPEGVVTLSVRYHEDNLQFSVSDTGIGIPASDIERVFEPFERAATSSGLITEGTGLGLSISKLLAERMGGTVSAVSQVNKGSTFKVIIPVEQVAIPSKSKKRDRLIVNYKGPQKNILVTDDDQAHCDLIRDILKPLGFILFSASSAEECLKIAKHCDADLFLLDISMPGMNGIELAKSLRQEYGKSTPIIMISANAMEEPMLKNNNHNHNHDDYLMKPIVYPSLLEKIRSNLNLEWVFQGENIMPPPPKNNQHFNNKAPPAHHIDELRNLGQIGHIRGIQTKLNDLEIEFPECKLFVSELRVHIDNFSLARFMSLLEVQGEKHDRT